MAGSTYSFRPSVVYTGFARLTFSIVRLPIWARFNAATGALTGTPDAAEAGMFAQVSIAVSDGVAKATLAPFSIQVLTPTPKAAADVSDIPFMVFDGLNNPGKPSAQSLGLTLMTPSQYYPQPASSGYAYVDYEPSASFVGSVKECETTAVVVVGLIQSMRASQPAIKIGAYALSPVGNYYDYVVTSPAPPIALDDALLPIVQASDYLLPEVYSFAGGDAEWTTFARGVAAEARRLAHGKPIYIFVSPQYLDPDNGLATASLVSAAQWTAQMQLAKALFDGVVLWSDQQLKWDPAAPWWKATQQIFDL